MSHTSDSTPTPTTGTSACAWCGLTVSAYGPDGARRDHCPSCLQSRHAGEACEGRMSPIAVAVPHGGDWRVIHRCVRCDELTSNPVRADDNPLVLMRVAVRPLAQPPFPLEAFGAL
ncbi:RNHCP domain-containing protein [Streptomyces showdoensis]|uniref:RNHCP domain protein n=1 Tax=Streptomyces showdoensis TaxID=68268 RepID=A0A2P2GK79_STREW|nr:RNHCP domain-containing protein [Streptomyces showdoensis]KKZ71215.1 RNHCP domain protein [Streptomyces showdoensis]